MGNKDIKLFDSHCHLDRFPGEEKIGGLISAAEDAGIENFLVPGVTGFPARIVELAEFSQVTIGWGVHPVFSENFYENCCDEIAQALKKSFCKVIGECGLDRRAPVKFDKQVAAFQWQIDLARDTGKPLIIHLVGHYEKALAMLKEAASDLTIVMHSFAASPELAERFLELGAYISFSGSIFRKNADTVKRLVNLVPNNRLLIETDSPDQKPAFWPGKLNEPACLEEIAARIAEYKTISVEKLSQITYKNAHELFIG
ncbi:MAG: TatD family hydrolase [Candidatus Rifleibacteriota bacterium]